MRRLLILLVLTVASVPASAQQWSGIVAPSRAIDWSNVGVAGGIPTRTTICATLSPGATSADISAAIAACPAGQVVFLNAGTYNLSAPSNQGVHWRGKSNVTLRGAGANQTFLVFTSGDGCNGFFADLCINSTDTNYVGAPSNVANWTAGYAKGTASITLSSFTNLKVGAQIILDQNDDPSDTGNKYVCQSTTSGGPCSLSGNVNNGARCNTGVTPVLCRDQAQVVQVLSCGTSVTGAACTSGNITITPGLYADNWNVGINKVPQAWWATFPVSGNGIENLSIDNTNAVNMRGIEIFNCLGCWVKGVRSIKSNKAHVEVQLSAKVTVRDNYFYGTQNAISQSYGVAPVGSSDVLAENNIIQYVTTPLQINGCVGCVLGYNFAVNPYYVQSPGYLITTIMLHTAGDDLSLIEGNVAPTIQGDVFHGSHNLYTFFRNNIAGWAPKCYSGPGAADFGSCINDLIPIGLLSWNREMNVIGNVLGTTGIQTGYENAGNFPIYALGAGNSNAGVTVPSDSITTQTLMRWGNYDTFTGTVRFQASEVPSGLAQYANPVPASTTLPPSFYYSAKPSWWPSAKAWPPIGPDVSGGNVSGVAGHANTLPAQDCYSNVMGGPADGVSSVLTFNPATCYAISPPVAPAAPTSLTGSVAASTVSLNWTASTGTPVPTAYTLYRGSVHGGPYSVVKSGLTSTSTTDTPPNGTWFYVTTGYVGGVISSISGSGTVATVTCTSSCAFPTGTVLVIGGNSVSAFNGTFTSTGQPTNSSFTFASSTGGTGTGGGTWQPAAESAKSNEVSATVPATLSVSLLPANRAFASQTVGTPSGSQSVTLTNTSGAGNTVTISNISITGANSGDFSQTNHCPSLLMSGLSCTINVTFQPTAAGARSATVAVVDNASGSPQTVSLSGTGVAATPGVNLNPTSLDFGQQTLSTTSTARSIILTNTGTGTLTITSIVASGDFAVTTVPATNCGGSLASLATCSLNVTFTPTATGGRTGAVTVTDNATGSPHVATLSGTGITTKCAITGGVTLDGQATVCQ